MNIMEKLERSAASLPIRANRLVGIPPAVYITASDEVQGSSDAEVSSNDLNFTLKKSFTVYRLGTLRLKFEVKRGDSSNTPAYEIRTYNGVSETTVVASTDITTTSYTEKTHDIAVRENDVVRIYMKKSATTLSYLQNLKVYFTITKSTIDYQITLE
jgi:hypothetical protein